MSIPLTVSEHACLKKVCISKSIHLSKLNKVCISKLITAFSFLFQIRDRKWNGSYDYEWMFSHVCFGWLRVDFLNKFNTDKITRWWWSRMKNNSKQMFQHHHLQFVHIIIPKRPPIALSPFAHVLAITSTLTCHRCSVVLVVYSR